ncbi:phospholipase D-like domain-containing protein [Leptospira sp. WS92.C1]
MKRIQIVFFLIFGVGCFVSKKSEIPFYELLRDRKIEVFFSYPDRYTPHFKKRNVRDHILKRIRETEFSIDFWIYSFDDSEILQELQNAKRRGVRIQILSDPEKEYSEELKGLGLFQRWDRSGLQHSKILIFDRKKVFLGSGNFTWYGLENDLNGYVDFELFDSEIESFYAFLKEDPGITALEIKPFLFYISPEKGRLSQNLLLREVDRAKHSIRYLIFDHFDSVLTSRLSLADRRGLEIQGVYDSPVDNEGKYLANVFQNPNSMILGDGNEERIPGDSFGKGGLLHHKTMILDERTLISGSYNFSVSARDHNREIMFRTEDSFVVNEYLQEWVRIKSAAIPYRPSFLEQKTDSANRFFFRFLEGSIPNDTEQAICRENFFTKESVYLESGESFFKSILEYSLDPGESCRTVSGFTKVSSGYTGRKSNHPVKTENFRNLGKLFQKDGRLLLQSMEVGSGQDAFVQKPVLLFLPDYFSILSGNIFVPNAILSSFSFRKAFLFQKGSGPYEIPFQQSGNLLSAVPNSTEGFLFLESDFAFWAFCFHSRSKTGVEFTELIDEMLSFRKSEIPTNAEILPEIVAIEKRKESGSYCYQY